MFGETVVRIREFAGAPDVYGNPSMTTVETAFDGAAFHPGESQVSLIPGRELMTTSPALYFPGQMVDGNASDRWRVRDMEYLADGRAAQWVSPWGGPGGTHIPLRQAAG